MRDTPDVYMDYNATTPVRAEAAEVFVRVLQDGFGNPSSSHFAGRRAKTILDESRESIAATLGAAPAFQQGVSPFILGGILKSIVAALTVLGITKFTRSLQP